MVAATRNEAAERVRLICDALHLGCVRYHDRIKSMGLPVATIHAPSTHEAEAGVLLPLFAAERRATVERIRERLPAIAERHYLRRLPLGPINAILDKEAAR